MVTFAVEVEDNNIVYEFMRDTHKRLQRKDLVKNPFIGRVVFLPRRLDYTKIIYLIEMESVYPKIYIFGFLILASFLIIFGFNKPLLLIIAIIFISPGLLHTKIFNYLIMSKGLRKAGYKGKIKLLSNGILLQELINSLL